MLTLHRLTSSSHPLFSWIEELIETSFPIEERRDVTKQRKLIDENENFYCNVIEEDGKAIGVINYWQLDDFYYLEHFATDPTLRNGGYGSKTLELLRKSVDKPIILEAEEPLDEMSRRRIGFYQRQGFTLQETPYLQPPYREGDDFLPLKLMTWGNIDMEQHSDRVISLIHRIAYGMKE